MRLGGGAASGNLDRTAQPARIEPEEGIGVFVYQCIDEVCTLEIRPPSMPRGVLKKLYKAAQNHEDEPLVCSIAKGLMARQSATVGVATGALSANLPAGENDGPYGSVVLANALTAIGCKVRLLADEPLFPVLRALAATCLREFELVPLVIGEPDEHAALADHLDVLLCVERAGVNPAGILHSMTGTDREGTRAKIDGLVQRMNAMGKLTVGIGDGGNEIGFGNIRERVKDLVPFGAVCRCPCGQGILTATPTTFLYPVSVSNWGGYGLAAALAVMTKDLSLAHTAEREREFFRIGMAHDCRDGQLGKNVPYLDGMHAETSVSICQILWNIVDLEIRGRHPAL